MSELRDMVENITESYNDVLNLFDKYKNKLSKAEQEINDILHIIEFGNVDGAGRMKLYKELKQARKERRKYKDKIEILQPLYEFMKHYDHIFKDKLPATKSTIYKKIKRHKNRTYRPRYRKELAEQYLDNEHLSDCN